MAKQIDFLNWNNFGLPDDDFSKENGVLVTRGRRYPLLIDPQMQGNTWIKTMELKYNRDRLDLLDPFTEGYMNKIELAISNGRTVILQNLDEEIDPSLEPILNKNLKRMAGKISMFLGDKEIKYDENFRLYMTTKLSNPRYKAEVSTRVTLVNFTVKEEGLVEQLISVVIS